MRTFYAFGICLLLLVPGISRGQEKQAQQGSQETQSAAPSSQTAPSQAVPHQFVITPEQKARKNPEKFTEESVEKGKSLYTSQCAMCHGKAGDGKGDLAEVMHVSPPDFTKPDTLAKRTDGELFTIINVGSTPMPAEENRLKEFQIWNMVNFLRSLEGKKPAKSSETQAGTTQP